MAKEIIPNGYRVLVKEDAKVEKTSTGIHLPNGDNEATVQRGTMIGVGDGKITDSGEHITVPFRKNDRVLFRGFGQVKLDAKGDVWIINAEDILATERETD